VFSVQYLVDSCYGDGRHLQKTMQILPLFLSVKKNLNPEEEQGYRFYLLSTTTSDCFYGVLMPRYSSKE
jgi:hypothetical protein